MHRWSRDKINIHRKCPVGKGTKGKQNMFAGYRPGAQWI